MPVLFACEKWCRLLHHRKRVKGETGKTVEIFGTSSRCRKCLLSVRELVLMRCGKKEKKKKKHTHPPPKKKKTTKPPPSSSEKPASLERKERKRARDGAEVSRRLGRRSSASTQKRRRSRSPGRRKERTARGVVRSNRSLVQGKGKTAPLSF